jgi:N-acetylneuraminate synthase
MITLKNFFLKHRYYNVSFLRCISSYPTSNEDINLESFNQFKKIFKDFNTGYSDHTNHDLAILGAVTLGAKIIEKHIALDFNIKNAQDWKVSFNELKFKDMVKKIRLLEKIMGKKHIFISKEEKKSIKWATKGIYAKKNIKKSSKFNLQNTCAKRPNNGVSVRSYAELLRKKSKSNIIKGQPLKRYQIV